jgi:hypothetical protein
MAARDQQHDNRPLEGRVIEQGGKEVALQVVDPNEGNVPSHRERLRVTQAHEQGADQSGAAGDCHRVDGGMADGTGPRERLGHHRRQQRQVGPTGQLGDDPTETGMQVDLARDHRRQHNGAFTHDGRGRLVARRLDAEHRRAIVGGDAHRVNGGRARSSASIAAIRSVYSEEGRS